MWPVILSLLALGTALLVVEVFIPGMVVGLAGFAALVGAAVLCYAYEGVAAGNLLLAGELIGGVIFTAWWLNYVPRSSIARRWTLHETVSPPPLSGSHAVAIGQTGEALTALRPAGLAEIAGFRTDVVTEGELVDAGEKIQVVQVEGSRVVVRRSTPIHSELSV